jgi:hypothetical protein
MRGHPKITKRARPFVALALFATVGAVAPSLARTQDDVHPRIADFSGTYENRRPDGGEAIITEAIREGTGSMRKVRRRVARRRLNAVNPPVHQITIRPNGEGVRIAYDEVRENRTPRLGVFADSRSADGGAVEVKHDLVGLTLHETYREKDGGAVNIFKLSNDGRALVLEVTITSPQLPGPIRYRLEFLRRPR